jgi:hypothetical protein
LQNIELLITAREINIDLHILLQFNDWSSCYPTDITIKKKPDMNLTEQEKDWFFDIQQDFKQRHAKHVIIDIVDKQLLDMNQ